MFNLLLPILCIAQMPETDIWLFKLTKNKGEITFTKGENITNRNGYDNQPSFTFDSKKIVFVSNFSSNQTDIYEYHISKKKINQLTKTEESEYSPSESYTENIITSVTVEKDSSQRIWAYHRINFQSSVLIPEIDSVGYYTWLNKDSILYYKLTNPHSLHAYDLINQKDVTLTKHPSRAFKKTHNSSKFIYAVKDSAQLLFWLYNPTLRETSYYCSSPSTQEDFIWHPDLGLIKSENNQLLRYVETDKKWIVLFSFESFGIQKISRFNFSSDGKYLVLVNNL
jgi:Tol biopolymer transport system component